MTKQTSELVKTDFAAIKGVEGTFGQHVYTKKEDLPKSLQRYFWQPEDGFFAWLHHPLYVTMLPTMAPLPLEQHIANLARRAEEALEENDFAGYVFRHERGYRMGKLMDLVGEGVFEDWGGFPRLAVKFWQLAADVWVDAEFDEDDPCWTDLMDTSLPNRWAMTDSKDRKRLAAMPETVTVYRGVQSWSEDGAMDYAHSGWSWTLSPKTARFFARRWLQNGQHPYVISAEVPKSLIDAYLTGRGEDEVLIRPGEAEAYPVRVQRVSRQHEPRGEAVGPEEEWTDG
jgi:hypothetical protein